MTAQEFCCWLRGLDLGAEAPDLFTKSQVDLIRRNLVSVPDDALMGPTPPPDESRPPSLMDAALLVECWSEGSMIASSSWNVREGRGVLLPARGRALPRVRPREDLRIPAAGLRVDHVKWYVYVPKPGSPGKMQRLAGGDVGPTDAPAHGLG